MTSYRKSRQVTPVELEEELEKVKAELATVRRHEETYVQILKKRREDPSSDGIDRTLLRCGEGCCCLAVWSYWASKWMLKLGCACCCLVSVLLVLAGLIVGLQYLGGYGEFNTFSFLRETVVERLFPSGPRAPPPPVRTVPPLPRSPATPAEKKSPQAPQAPQAPTDR